MLEAILSLIGSLCGPLLRWFQQRQSDKAATQKADNQLSAESHSQDITDAGHLQVEKARQANADLVSSVGDDVMQQSADVAAAIASANRVMRRK